MINIIIGGVCSFYDKQTVHIDELEKWSTFQLKMNGKIVIVITMYRIPNSSEQGVFKVITQYNKMRR